MDVGPECEGGIVPLNLTAIDFETANSSAASACSVGLVKVRDGRIVDRVGWLIQPPAPHDAFTEWNTRIHGIRAEDAQGWLEQLPAMLEFIDGDALAAHNAGFDMGVIAAACLAVRAPVPQLDYACSLRIARRTYNLDSYRLPVAAMAAGFEDFAHHNAIADAEACAAIMVHAAARHGAGDLAELAELSGTKILKLGAPVAAA